MPENSSGAGGANGLLMPSQAINSSNHGSTNSGNSSRQRTRGRNNRGRNNTTTNSGSGSSNPVQQGAEQGAASSPTQQQQSQSQSSTPQEASSPPPQEGTATNAAGRPSNSKKRRDRARNKNKKKNNAEAPAPEQQGSKPPAKAQHNQQKKKPKKKRNNNNNNNNKKQHAWWRKQVPLDAVDPITLDPLVSLNYPPFALVGTQPYEPIDWPPVGNDTPASGQGQSAAPKLSEEERQKRILEEQWGKSVKGTLISDDDDQEDTNGKKPAAKETDIPEQRQQQQQHVNLFDGRALAYYMVSQLQFIDPLNRRDLTRDELVHLDRYLRRHQFLDLNVTEAYDAKGVTLSTAGSAAQTAAGRARMLQDEARGLLGALFGHHAAASAAPTTATTTTPSSNNNLAQLYLQHEAAQQLNDRVTTAEVQQQQHLQYGGDNGIYQDSPGLVVIDDDDNPGLRGSAPAFVPSAAAAAAAAAGTNGTANTLYSASHIVNRYQGHNQRAQQHDFPSLADAAPLLRQTAEAPPPAPAAKKTLPKAKTLSKIGSMVKKTDEKELQRQWEAREEARKKALLSNLTFGSNHALKSEPSMNAEGVPSQITTSSTGGAIEPSDAQLQRNRAFAEALGVKPATMRTNLNSGWTRPSEGRLLVDEFGTELNLIRYPESLVAMAREISGAFLLKLEKKWKTFLADDTSASLPLNPMDRPTRAFVHAYSDYWKLHTESFDMEPKRYIHCVKLRETSAPYPLLSEALPHWRPPPLDHSSQQTAGQTTKSTTTAARELPPGPARVPLTLKPRTPDTAVVVDLAATSGVPIGGTRHRSMEQQSEDSEGAVAGRFQGLGRDRPKLELQKRTKPLELPPFEGAAALAEQANFDAAEELERQRQRAEAKARAEREQALRHQQLLADAFASDEEEEKGAKSDYVDDCDSDWEEQKPMFSGEDDEE